MKNCWTCKHNTIGNHCDRPRAGSADPINVATDAWIASVILDQYMMPLPDADGCPGYDPIFAPQASWSTDRMDGSGNATNPSGIAADPSATVHHVYIPWNDTLIKGDGKP